MSSLCAEQSGVKYCVGAVIEPCSALVKGVLPRYLWDGEGRGRPDGACTAS